jgi:predicted ATP-binding protein involved in virulence
LTVQGLTTFYKINADEGIVNDPPSEISLLVNVLEKTMSKPNKDNLIYFSELRIENIKCFERAQKLDLKNVDGKIARWTLILGENGVGKTTLLKCLSWMVPVQAPDDIKQRNIKTSKGDKERIFLKPFMDDFDNESVYDQLVRVGKSTVSNIEAVFSYGLQLGDQFKEKSQVAIGMNFKRVNGKLETVEAQKQQVEQFNTPTIFAYNAKRHMAFKNLDNPELKDPLSNFFSDSGDLYDAEQVLEMLDNGAHRHGDGSIVKDLLERVKQILADLLPDIVSKENIIINPSMNKDGSINPNIVEVKTHDGQIKLKDLSLGYQTMFAWIVDLALRMLWAAPEHNAPLSMPAIVIIDEVDLHLHPIWQRDVRDRLTHHFPKTQFICTAHSPFMAQASEDENLCVIKREENGIYIQNEPTIVKGWRIGQIATSELFGLVTERGPEEQKYIEERRSLLDKSRLSKEEKQRLAELDKKLSELPTVDSETQKVFNLVNNAVELLKKNGIINDQDQQG